MVYGSKNVRLRVKIHEKQSTVFLFLQKKTLLEISQHDLIGAISQLKLINL